MDSRIKDGISQCLAELKEWFDFRISEPNALEEITKRTMAIVPYVIAVAGTDDSSIIAEDIRILMESESERQHFFRILNDVICCKSMQASACKI